MMTSLTKWEVNLWPKGYEEDFKYVGIDVLKSAIKELKGDSVLEIGCGNGRWTNELLVPKFKRVVAVDVIDKPKYNGFEYHKLTGCDLSFLCDKSIDCVYSYGVFCHLPLDCQFAYLKEIKRIMKGNGLIMFANWNRHKDLKHVKVDHLHDWYYNDIKTTDKMIKEAGLSWYDFDEDNRDTIAIIC